MRLKISLFLLCMLLLNCNKDEVCPTLNADPVDFANISFNNIDTKRLCLAELISKLFLDKKFRVFLRSKSINNDQKWNNEVVLLQYWDEILYDNSTFFDLLVRIIDSDNDLCISDQEELIEIMNSDPLLVLKIPDLLEAGDWDIDKTIPFLYVKTNQLVRNHPQTDTSSIIGIHPSGFIDRYISGFPNYFPIVLKKSQDYFLIDSQFNLSNGVNLLHYHNFDPDLLAIDDISNYPISIDGSQLYMVYINDLISASNISSNKIQEPFTVESCNETCKFKCIPNNERKLTTSQLIIDNQNSNALSYIYTSVYRAGSHLILEDNNVLMIITQHSGDLVTKEWKRNIIGSFRVEDLFNVDKQFTIRYQEYTISENLHALPEINIIVDVIDITPVPLNNLVLASEIVENDLLRFASIRIKLDMLVRENIVLDGKELLVTEYFQDNLTNYDLFCFNIENSLGFNSMAIQCDF